MWYEIYMKRLILKNLEVWKTSKSRKPLIVDGVRQVGKTYILMEFGNQFSRCHYFNFEKERYLSKVFDSDLNPDRIVKELSLVRDTEINVDSDLIFFDEIQECPNALTSLKYFNEELPKLALVSAGSLLGVHLNSKSFPVGKVDMLKMRPMNFEEFLLALGESRIVEVLQNAFTDGVPEVVHRKIWKLLLHYFVVGGLPEAVKSYRDKRDSLVEAFSTVRNIQSTLYKGYLADMTKHSEKVNAMHLERAFNAVPEQLSRVQNGSAPKFVFKDVVPKVRGYERLSGVIDWLQKAGLVVKVPICIKGMKPFKAYSKENSFKLFMFDIGMLGALADLSPKTILDYDYGTYKGYFAENFVLQELLQNRNETIFSWHENTAEIEFLIEENGQVIPIEVKSGNSVRSKSLSVFTKKYEPETRIRFSGKPFESQVNGLLCLPVYFAGFLKNKFL